MLKENGKDIHEELFGGNALGARPWFPFEGELAKVLRDILAKTNCKTILFEKEFPESGDEGLRKAKEPDERRSRECEDSKSGGNSVVPDEFSSGRKTVVIG